MKSPDPILVAIVLAIVVGRFLGRERPMDDCEHDCDNDSQGGRDARGPTAPQSAGNVHADR
jgi:hypothetical protein